MLLKQDNSKMQNLNIVTDKKNLLFNRREIRVSIEADLTPNREEVKKLISEHFSAQIGNIKIKKISGRFGSRIFTIIANIYNSKEDLEKIESLKREKQTKNKVAKKSKSEEEREKIKQ